MIAKNSTDSNFLPKTINKKLKIILKVMLRAELIKIISSHSDSIKEKLAVEDQEYQKALIAFVKASRKYNQIGRPLINKHLFYGTDIFSMFSS